MPEARALLLLRCNVLAKGYSGIRPQTLQLALDMLNRGVLPVVPERGSVGASGDLAPLAHLALVLIGEGEAFVEGERLPGTRSAGARRPGAGRARGQGGPGAGQRHPGDVRRRRARPAARARRSPRLADLAGAMTLEGLLGQPPPVHRARSRRVRPHPGQIAAAPSTCARSSRDSEIVESHAELRQGPGPLLAALHAAGARRGARRPGLRAALLAIEVNAATDNPLVFAETRTASSPAATSTASRSRWRSTCWRWRLHPARGHQRAPGGAAGEPSPERACRRSSRRTPASTPAS